MANWQDFSANLSQGTQDLGAYARDLQAKKDKLEFLKQEGDIELQKALAQKQQELDWKKQEEDQQRAFIQSMMNSQSQQGVQQLQMQQPQMAPQQMSTTPRGYNGTTLPGIGQGPFNPMAGNIPQGVGQSILPYYNEQGKDIGNIPNQWTPPLLSQGPQPVSQGSAYQPESFTYKGVTFKKPKDIENSIENKKFNFEKENKQKKQEEIDQRVKIAAQQTINTVTKLKDGLRYFGAMGDVPPWMAEYSKKDWLANYNTLKDKLVVDLMLQLKAASSSGATGFGQLSEKEGMRLENAASAINKGLSEKDALGYLDEIEDASRRILQGQSSKNEGSMTSPNQSNDSEYNRYLQSIGVQ